MFLINEIEISISFVENYTKDSILYHHEVSWVKVLSNRSASLQYLLWKLVVSHPPYTPQPVKVFVEDKEWVKDQTKHLRDLVDWNEWCCRLIFLVQGVNKVADDFSGEGSK